MNYLPKTYAIVDVETTGMRSYLSRIIEIGIVRVEDGEIVKKYSTFLNPGVSLPHMITGITGITDSDLVNAPTFEEVTLEIQEILEGAVFIAHNAAFDYSFVKAEFKCLGINWKATTLCSVKLSRTLYPRHRSHSLDALISRFGLTCEARHRAYDDAYAVQQFFEKLTLDHTPEAIRKAVEMQIAGGPRVLYDRTNVLKGLPDTPGVYYFYDDKHEPLYIGKSKNIRTRVRSHFSDHGSGREEVLCAGTAEIEVEETPGELSAFLLESRRIKAALPKYNRLLRKPKKMIAALQVTTSEGYNTIELTSQTSIDPTQPIAALFRTMSQAKSKIREIALEHMLCEKLLGLEKASGTCFGYHIERCLGACKGSEKPDEYNKRFKSAFARRRIKSWPYRDAVMIKEVGAHVGAGAVFLVKEWRIIASYTYEDGATKSFLEPDETFDYDTYKLLARYMLRSENRRSITELTVGEFTKLRRELEGEYETVIS